MKNKLNHIMDVTKDKAFKTSLFKEIEDHLPKCEDIDYSVVGTVPIKAIKFGNSIIKGAGNSKDTKDRSRLLGEMSQNLPKDLTLADAIEILKELNSYCGISHFKTAYNHRHNLMKSFNHAVETYSKLNNITGTAVYIDIFNSYHKLYTRIYAGNLLQHCVKL